MIRIAVVGGGITGLSAARLLALHGVEVIVLEAGNRWGGKLAPVAINGVRLDGGAESILARRPEGLRLINDLDLGSRVVHPTEAKPNIPLARPPARDARLPARRTDRCRATRRSVVGRRLAEGGLRARTAGVRL